MKQIVLIITLLIGFGISNAQTFPDQMAIEIIPEDYSQPSEVRILKVDALKFMHSTIPITAVAPEFDGYNFLAMKTSASYAGKIVPSATGEIYLVASGTLATTALVDWIKTDYEVKYFATNRTTTLYIYKLHVNYGDTINIPVNSNFAGLAPVAKSITIKEKEEPKEGDIDNFDDITLEIGSGPITLEAKATGNRTVNYTIEEGKESVATLEGNVLTIVGVGEAQITARAEANDEYVMSEKTITLTIVSYDWLLAPTIAIHVDTVKVVGIGADVFKYIYINNEEGNDLSQAKGEVTIKATSEDEKEVIILKINR
ncbi:MAG: hypothetical protein PHG06_06155 [Parabacteroides sp.]|nr:hypothetical protein [Parabacteroides sp.]